MSITQDEIFSSGCRLRAAPAGEWRAYDEANPVPGYFEFDWLSSRHPDLYHDYALTSLGLLEKLHALIDLSGRDVLDIGAGTGRSAVGAANKARRVFALDWYQSVALFAVRLARQDRIRNVHYINADRGCLPLPANSVDAVINCWAELDAHEAYRVLKPGGDLIRMGAVADGMCGELTAELASEFPWLGETFAPEDVYQPGCPDRYLSAELAEWEGIPVLGPVHTWQFTFVAEYGDCSELAAMAGRLYGPKAKQYFLRRRQSSFAWRLQIVLGRVRK